MKPLTKLSILSAAFSSSLLLIGCATEKSLTQPPSATALVCPDCKTVLLGPFQTAGAWRGEPPATVAKHECSGCRGVIGIRSDEPGFRHECSVCKQSPFSCQATHSP